MKDEFACEFILDVFYDGETLAQDYDYLTFTSSIYDLYSMMDFRYDLFDIFADSNLVVELLGGRYHVFIRGTVFYNHEVDWETGIDEGGWIFEWKDEDVHIAPLKL